MVELPEATRKDVVRGRHISELTTVEGYRKGREALKELLSEEATRRHNVRNDLTVIEGHAESLAAADFDGDRQAVAEAVLDRASARRAVSEKARVVEAIVDSRGERVCHELPELLGRALTTVESEHPDATIERVVPNEGPSVAARSFASLSSTSWRTPSSTVATASGYS